MQIDGKYYEVMIVRKNNRNTYIRVKNGKIIVTTNYLTSTKNVEKIINDNISSIKKMINIDIKKMEKEEEFYYFGKKYNVIYGFSNLEIIDDKIYVLNKKELEKWLKKDITRVYSNHLEYWYNKFTEDIPIPNLKIRKMTSRWGVCNIRNHNVTLNSNLSKYDIDCLDYVIVHELSHFIHHNHSKSFWLLVSKYCFNYKDIRKEMKSFII